jgi:D-amino-acid oxidase
MTQVDAVVVGAGVAGLTTAIALAETGLATRVLTASPPPGTTSAAAGAIWGPVLCGPPDRCREWARIGLSVLSGLVGEPAAAVRQVSGRQVSREPASPPDWMELLPGGARICSPAELPDGFATGWRYTAPVVTMPPYLDYLRARYEAAGGTISVGQVSSLASLDAPIVVNCSGIGARELVPDLSVVPVRGQVVVVRNPGIEEFYIDHTLHGYDYVYMFPHGDVVLLGGTAEEGAWDWPARPSVSERILRDCTAVDPRLRGAEVVAHRVGLRPVRPTVRLEAEPLPGGGVLWHNYGHGGGGVTLSWGCAREITEGVLAGASAPASLPSSRDRRVSCRRAGRRARLACT